MTTRTSSGSPVPQPAWTFVYLGANQDSYDEADHLGFDGTNTQNFRGDGLGTRHAMLSVDRAVRDYRRSPVAKSSVVRRTCSTACMTTGCDRASIPTRCSWWCSAFEPLTTNPCLVWSAVG